MAPSLNPVGLCCKRMQSESATPVLQLQFDLHHPLARLAKFTHTAEGKFALHLSHALKRNCLR